MDTSSNSITIDRESNKEIMKVIYRNLKKFARAGKDGKLQETSAAGSSDETSNATTEATAE